MEELLLHDYILILSGKYSQWKFQMVTDIKVSRFFYDWDCVVVSADLFGIT